jgi:hypothetical protein
MKYAKVTTHTHTEREREKESRKIIRRRGQTSAVP